MEDPLVAQFQKSHDQGDHDDRERNPEPGDDDSENDDYSDEIVGNSAHHPSTVPYATRQMGPQTGPKGVVADHAFFQKTQREAQAQARAEYNARMLAKAPTTTTYLQDEAAKEFVLQSQIEEEDDDDAAIRRYREKRLQELKCEGQQKDERVFGQVFDIDADDYATAIDMEFRGVSVLVHLYDEAIPACRKLDEFWPSLARKFALAKFVRVSAIELEFDLVESPAVLGYKGGNLIANLVRFVDHVGPQFTAEAVEEALLGNGALCYSDIYHADD